MKLDPDAPLRAVTEVGPGDFVKVEDSVWKQIVGIIRKWSPVHPEGPNALPHNWIVDTKDGERYDMYQISRYARANDFE